MQAKANRYARGEASEPSVVQSPRARAIGGISNAVFGIAYYGGLLAAVWFLHVPTVYYLALVAAAAAGMLSLYLAYSLLFVTRMSCAFCWTSHVVNWSLLVILAASRKVWVGA